MKLKLGALLIEGDANVIHFGDFDFSIWWDRKRVHPAHGYRMLPDCVFAVCFIRHCDFQLEAFGKLRVYKRLY